MKKIVIYAVLIFQIALIISLLKSIQGSISARSRVETLELRKEELQREREELEGKLAYVESDFYVEKVAREELQLTKPGETVVIVPEELRNNEFEVQAEAVETEKPNYLKWWEVVTGQH